jgi:threonine dehydratase
MPEPAASICPTIQDVQAARRRVRGNVLHTPLVIDQVLSTTLGRPVLVKAECLQITGSFKLRGAYNRLAAMGAAERRCGVVAFSSGNHAQGVAAAASMFGVPSVIVMPADAPAIKVEGTRRWGGDVVFYDRETESRETIAAELSQKRGATLIPSFDDPYVIAGQGTAGLEIAADVAQMGLRLGAVICPVGGGGLAGGLGLALRAAAPDAVLLGAEPAGFDDAWRSLEAGRIVANPRKSGSSQDALLTPEISPLTFALLRAHMTGISVVTDEQADQACRHAARHLKLVAEPGGAAGLAAVLAGAGAHTRGALVIVLSGGNAG